MDWLLTRQDPIEAKLARRHLTSQTNPHRMALFDLSSSWVEGRHCPLAARGYSRDGKKGKAQIEYGLLTDPAGRPIAVRVFPGNTGDPTAFIEAVKLVRNTFGLRQMVMVGDRGMITSARIDALRELPDADGFGWLTCLRAPQIAALAADDGPPQMSLFDQHDLAEISHPDYPGERLIACRNPALAQERARKRAELLDATETLLAPIVTAVADGRLAGAADIGLRVGNLIDKHKMAKHLDVAIADTTLSVTRRQANIDAEAALDGIYAIRTSVPANQLDPANVVTAYKNLSHVERDWRTIKVDDLDLRPMAGRRWRLVIAIDGKVERGAQVPDGRQVHLLSAYDISAGMVLAQVQIAAKSNEIPAFAPLLDRVVAHLGSLNGVLVVADALHAQTGHAEQVAARGGHLMVSVKGNQPTLFAQLKALPWAQVPVGERRREIGHGRKETRTVKALTVATPGGLGFPHAEQAVRITRTRTIKATTTREKAYLVVSLPAEHAQPVDLGTWARSEWHIENRVHYVRDVTLREDAHQARTGNGPAVFATLRNTSIGYHRIHGEPNIARATRRANRRPHDLINAVTSSNPTTQ